MGEPKNLGELLRIAIVIFGKDSKAVAFVREKIEQNGEDDELISDSSQILFSLATIHYSGKDSDE